MDINKYNTRVRQAISDEIVKCSERKQEYKTKHACDEDFSPYTCPSDNDENKERK